MPTLINNPVLEEALIAERRERGLDKYDEVWDGVYVMAPLANNEHQQIQTRFSSILTRLVDFAGLGRVYGGANVSDQPDDWTRNYRVPDVLVFVNGNTAEDRGTHWLGGPDFAVEIVSRWDRSREKLDFYSGVGVRELLIIDRDPWQLELFRLTEGQLRSVTIATQQNGLVVESQVVPISLSLTGGQKRPAIAVKSQDGQSWSI
jgi:Uma2 family endonuclease